MDYLPYAHPVVGAIAVLVGIVALLLGVQSILSTRGGGRKKFNWPMHVLLGKISLILLPFIVAGGFYVANQIWSEREFTEGHVFEGIAMLCLGLIGLFSGMFLANKKSFQNKSRFKVVKAHGVINLFAMLFGIALAVSGMGLFDYIY